MIIVTGANGFIGSAMVWELNQAGHRGVICVDTVTLKERSDLLAKREYTKFLHKDEIWAYLDTADATKDVEAIFHMGACSSTTEMNIDFLNENNVEYTRKLWNWCTTHHKTYIYASSAATYGDGAQGFDDAADPKRLKPLNPYGDSKVIFDRWALEQTQVPPKWAGLRFFNVYGPNELHKGFQMSVVGKAFDEIRKTGSLKLFRSHNPVYKDGEQKRDFIYVKDVTRWMLEIFDKKDFKSGVYNMGSGHARTWLDVAGQAFKSLNRPMKIDWIEIPETIRDRYQYFTEAKMNRLMAQGLSKSEWPLERGIDDYIRNYLTPASEGKDGLL